MQILFLPSGWTLLLCFVLWPVFQLSAAIICLKIPDRYYSPTSFPYKTFGWEQSGAIYDKVFKVRKWKGLLPDGGAAFSAGYRKKNLDSFSRTNLDKYVVESCRAEMTHLLAILPFWVFGLFTPFPAVFIMLFYALAVNIPCAIAQRYNRPRIERILKMKRSVTAE